MVGKFTILVPDAQVGEFLNIREHWQCAFQGELKNGGVVRAVEPSLGQKGMAVMLEGDTVFRIPCCFERASGPW